MSVIVLTILGIQYLLAPSFCWADEGLADEPADLVLFLKNKLTEDEIDEVVIQILAGKHKKVDKVVGDLILKNAANNSGKNEIQLINKRKSLEALELELNVERIKLELLRDRFLTREEARWECLESIWLEQEFLVENESLFEVSERLSELLHGDVKVTVAPERGKLRNGDLKMSNLNLRMLFRMVSEFYGVKAMYVADDSIVFIE